MDLIKRKQNNILLHIVNIGERKVSIPVAQLGNGEGKTILITAGVDGDEYSGIEAAYALIDYYTKTKWKEKLIIIPIVNILGFQSAVSWNPQDKKYPKHIFPGKEKGSSTEKLMYWLATNFVKNADVWIDLHSGASTERIEPFMQLLETSKKELNQKSLNIIQNIKAKNIVYTKGSSIELAKMNCTYVRFESGQLGQRNKKDIKQHIDWVKQLLSSSVIMSNEVRIESRKKLGKKVVYTEVKEFLAEKDGIWIPLFQGNRVIKGKMLGEIRSLDGKILQKIAAKDVGIFLWRREAMSCQKGDSLYAFAHNKSSL